MMYSNTTIKYSGKDYQVKEYLYDEYNTQTQIFIYIQLDTKVSTKWQRNTTIMWPSSEKEFNNTMIKLPLNHSLIQTTHSNYYTTETQLIHSTDHNKTSNQNLDFKYKYCFTWSTNFVPNTKLLRLSNLNQKNKSKKTLLKGILLASGDIEFHQLHI